MIQISGGGNIPYIPPPMTFTPNVKVVSPNPVSGIKKLLAYGVVYVVLIGIGATDFWQLAYLIEGAALLSLLLKTVSGSNKPAGALALDGIAQFISGAI